ncbi:MAG: outer membrane lipoprotein carrier protein LolA [Leptospira sp.]|nr:outer membrane lipoprotein carrier protein LolA [Leptospira sp.]
MKFVSRITFLTLTLCHFPAWTQNEGNAIDTVINAMNSFDSIHANISFNGVLTGTLSYKRPNQLHIKFSDGRVISANGRILWFYSPVTAIAGKQDLKNGGGGIASLLTGYDEVNVQGKVIRLKSETRRYEEIILTLGQGNLIKAIRMKSKGSDNFQDISLSGIQTNIGLSSNLFNFHPPANAQIVENPLNQRE